MSYTSGLPQYSDVCQCGSLPEEHSLGDYQPHGFTPFTLPARDDVNPILASFRSYPGADAKEWTFIAVAELADDPHEEWVPVLRHAIMVLSLLAILRRTHD